MKFLPTFNERSVEACEALRAEHLPDAPPFVAYQLHGHINNPIKLELYDRKPEYDTQPFCVYERNEQGDLVTEFNADEYAAARKKAKR